MLTFKNLKKLAGKKQCCVGTFTTNGMSFYQDSVLYVAVGTEQPRARNDWRILKIWDVSYSIGRPENGNNKWARAIQAAYKYLKTTKIPNYNDLAENVEYERAERRRASARNRYKKHRELMLQDHEFEALPAFSIRELYNLGIVSEKQFSFYCYDEDRDDKDIHLWGDKLIQKYHNFIDRKNPVLMLDASSRLGWYTVPTIKDPTILTNQK